MLRAAVLCAAVARIWAQNTCDPSLLTPPGTATAKNAALCGATAAPVPENTECEFDDTTPFFVCTKPLCTANGWDDPAVTCAMPTTCDPSLLTPGTATATNAALCGATAPLVADGTECEFQDSSGNANIVCQKPKCFRGTWDVIAVTCGTDECDAAGGGVPYLTCNSATPAQICIDGDYSAPNTWACTCDSAAGYVMQPGFVPVDFQPLACTQVSCRVSILNGFCDPNNANACATEAKGVAECDNSQGSTAEANLNTVCEYTLPDYTCAPVQCVSLNTWDSTSITCTGNPCETGQLMLPPGATADDASVCGPSMSVDDGHKCNFSLAAYDCTPVKCVAGTWVADPITSVANPQGVLTGTTLQCIPWEDECCAGCAALGTCTPATEQECVDPNKNNPMDWECRCFPPPQFVVNVVPRDAATCVPYVSFAPVAPALGCAYDVLNTNNNEALPESFLNCDATGVVPYMNPSGGLYPCYFLDTAVSLVDPPCIRALCVQNATSNAPLANDWESGPCLNTKPTVGCNGEDVDNVTYPQTPCPVNLTEDASNVAHAPANDVVISNGARTRLHSSSPPGANAEAGQKVFAECSCIVACKTVTVDWPSGQPHITFPPNFVGPYEYQCKFTDDGIPRLFRERLFKGEVQPVNDAPSLMMLKSTVDVTLYGEKANITGNEFVASLVYPGPKSAVDEYAQPLRTECTASDVVFTRPPSLALVELDPLNPSLAAGKRGLLEYAVFGGTPAGSYFVRCEVFDTFNASTALAPIEIAIRHVSLILPTAENVATLHSERINGGPIAQLRFELKGSAFRAAQYSLRVKVIGPSDPLPADEEFAPFVAVRSMVDVTKHRWGLAGMSRRESTRFIQARLNEDRTIMDLVMFHEDYIALVPETFEVTLMRWSMDLAADVDYDFLCMNSNCTTTYTIQPQFDAPLRASGLDYPHLILWILLFLLILIFPCSVSAANKLSFLSITRTILLCPRPPVLEGAAEAVPLYLNPLGMSVGGGTWEESQAAVVFALSVMAFLGVLSLIVTQLFKSHAERGLTGVELCRCERVASKRRIDPQYVAARARVGCLLLPAALLLPIALCNGISVVVHSEPAWKIVGGAALLLCLAVFIYAYRVASESTSIPRVVLLPNVHRNAEQDITTRWMFGFDEWLPHERTPNSHNWLILHRLVFEPFHEKGRFHVVIEFLALLVMGGLAAWRPVLAQDCTMRALVMIGILVGLSSLCLMMSPYLATFDNVCDFVILLVIAGVIGCDLASTLYENPRIHWTATASMLFVTVTMFLILAKGIVEAFLYHRNGGYPDNLVKYDETAGESSGHVRQQRAPDQDRLAPSPVEMAPIIVQDEDEATMQTIDAQSSADAPPPPPHDDSCWYPPNSIDFTAAHGSSVSASPHLRHSMGAPGSPHYGFASQHGRFQSRRGLGPVGIPQAHVTSTGSLARTPDLNATAMSTGSEPPRLPENVLTVVQTSGRKKRMTTGSRPSVRTNFSTADAQSMPSPHSVTPTVRRNRSAAESLPPAVSL